MYENIRVPPPPPPPWGHDLFVSSVGSEIDIKPH